MPLPVVSIILSPHTAPERYVPLARRAEEAGVTEIWVWEDCFYESGIAAAAAILGATERTKVGIGLLPVPLRAVSLTAMEISTIARMFPGRLMPGIGHGVLDWMAQAGVRVRSPLTLLREYATALRSLLAGEEVSTEGRYVNLDRVRLNWPADPTPPILMGAEGPKTLALAGELGDGILLVGSLDAEQTGAKLRTALDARSAAGVTGDYTVVKFDEIAFDASADQVRAKASALAEVGVQRMPLLTLDAEGRPDPGDGIERLIDTVAEVMGR
ncbi:LLM class flavin-dependent oxidoreductase [Enemella sp. A6]|uniref:LLM class flavin-dependent oxidoreductase n=1 Tax=Enemella sp. A6 TaxID=3440152 RepID=UPI003EB7D187